MKQAKFLARADTRYIAPTIRDWIMRESGIDVNPQQKALLEEYAKKFPQLLKNRGSV